MKLSDAASHFARTVFADAYDPTSTITGKLMAFEDATRDSLSADRRMLSVVPGTVIPQRRALLSDSYAWLVGDVAVDYHMGKELRNKYILHQATELARMYTFEGALASTVTKEFWANRLWVKGTKETDESSGVYDAYVVYASRTEDLRHPDWATGNFFDGREQHVLVQIDSRWHLVRTSYISAGGFLACVVDELPEPVLPTVTYTVRTYNPVPDTFTTSDISCSAVLLRWQSNFEYLTRYSLPFQSGDVVVKILKTAVTVAKANDLVDIRGRKFKVLAVTDEAPVWSLHLRHA